MTSPAAEETVRLNAERCRALIAAIAEIVWTTDASGQVVEDQPAWRAFTGQSREEILGVGWLAAVDPDSREEAVTAWSSAAVRGLPYQTEWRLRRRDGEHRSFLIRAVPIRTANGAVREWIGCNVDITHLRQPDEKLKRQVRDMQILKNLGDTLQACNTREEAYPFIALAATELFPGARGALAVPATGMREMFATAIEWGGDAPGQGEWMKADFAVDDCWALRRGGLHEPGVGTVCQHFMPGAGEPHACVPLAVRGELSGLLSIRFAETKRLDEERLRGSPPSATPSLWGSRHCSCGKPCMRTPSAASRSYFHGSPAGVPLLAAIAGDAPKPDGWATTAASRQIQLSRTAGRGTLRRAASIRTESDARCRRST